MKRVSILLITVVLVAGVMGCGPDQNPTPDAPLPYGLSISSTAGGSVTVTVDGEETVVGPGETEVILDIPAGTEVDLVTSPSEGYEFVEWTGAPVDGVTDPLTTVDMQDNYEITATFGTIPTYALTMTANPELAGMATDVTNGSPYEQGTIVNIRAEAAEGYQFVNWTAPAGSFGNASATETTFTTPGQAVTVTANFEMIPPPAYELTVAAAPEIGGTATDMTNGSPYEEGTTVNIQAEAAEGYQFANWTAPAGSFGNASATETTFTMPGQVVTVTANFEMIPPPTYEVTMAAAPEIGGTATDMTNESPYEEGTIVNIRAEAAEGYQFVNWRAPAGSFGNASEAETIFTMPGQAVTVTANFELIPPPTYELTMAVSPSGSGTATDETNTGPYTEGTEVSITATANQGYHFVNWTAPAGAFDNPNEAETIFTMPGQAVIVTASFAVEPMVAAGGYHTVGLHSDGTVVATGDNGFGQCDVGAWSNIIQVAAGYYHTVGLRADGTAVAAGSNGSGQCDIAGWANIVQVAAGGLHTVGLKADGSVVAAGANGYGQCSVGGWTNIMQVAAGYRHTVGLEADGTVIAVGDNYFGQCNVGAWTDTVQVTAGGYHTLGLESDGTVVAAGNDWFDQCDVSAWTDIGQVTAGYHHTVGLKSNGTVVATGANDYGQCNVGAWADIIQIAAGYYHTVGFESDGTVVAIGLNTGGQCDVSGWNLN